MKTTEGSQAAAVSAPAMPDIRYEMNDKGEITRTDKDSTLHVATYNAEAKSLLFASEKALRFRVPVIRFLNDNGLKKDSEGMIGEEADKPQANIPKRPKMDLQLGDKTPAVVEWYRKYKPQEYKVRYGIKGPGTVRKIVRYDVNEKTGKKTPVYEEVQATIALRKIHTTERVEANDAASLDEEGGDE
jgi:hypothetical protein